MLALIDGDIVVFRCGFAAERNEWHLSWDPDQESPTNRFRETKVFEYKREAMDHLDKVCPGQYSRVQDEDYALWPEKNLEPLSHALQNVKTFMRRTCETLGVSDFDLRVMLSQGSTFRHDLAKTRPYKGTRKVEHRPTHEHAIKDFMKETYDCYVGQNEEADDLLGIWATKYPDSIIVTLDKDLDMIPGPKYNWMKELQYTIDDAQAMLHFHTQLLTGDTTDNIPGLPGIGIGKASKALHGCETNESQMEEVIRMYQIHSGKEDWAEYLLEQGQLLWIRRQPNEMWELPSYSMQAGFESDWGNMELTLELD